MRHNHDCLKEMLQAYLIQEFARQKKLQKIKIILQDPS